MAEVPLVCLIDDIKPNDLFTSGPLTYDNLAPAALRYEQADGALTSSLWTPGQTIIQQEQAARNAASAYLVRTAHQGTTARTAAQRDLWDKRYTQASIEFYGQPDPAEARRLIHDKQRRLLDLRSHPKADQHQVGFLLNFYASVVGEPDPDSTAPSIDTKYWPEIAQFMDQHYAEIFKLLEDTAVGKDILTTEEYAPVFADAVQWLAENRPEWADWKVTEKLGGFAVYQETKEIIVGANPAGLSRLRIKTLLAHEVLTHAMRSATASKFGDRDLEPGLPGYDVFEEGIATLIGWAVSGKATQGAIDFYIDIALALGSIDGRPRSRDELLRMSRARAIINAQTEENGAILNDDELRRVYLRANQIINRIFRGGLLTKEVIYHHGYNKADSYIKKQRARGLSIGHILSYLMLGGFDPSIDIHQDHVLERTGQRLS